MENNIADYLHKLINAGLSIIPIAEGKKNPHSILGKSHSLLEIRSTHEELDKWLLAGVKSWGVANGTVSNNLVTLDFDEKNYDGLYELFCQKLSAEQREIISRCVISKTRNNGTHIRYFTESSWPTVKVAQSVVGEKILTTAEVRGERSYALIPPSDGYTLIQGDLLSIPKISDEEHEIFLDVRRTFNEVIDEPATPYENSLITTFGERPGDRFNATATWKEILTPFGWAEERKDHWRRPGKKEGEGISATTNHDGKPMFYVFSTSASPFQANRGYTKFHAYALLKHNGDFTATAKEILEKETPISENNKITSLTHRELMSQEFPNSVYTIDPFFEQGTMNMVSAPPNTYKSWLLFLFAGHIANGTLVFDKFVTKKDNVMIINEEDQARLVQDRLKLLKITDETLPIFYSIARGSKLTEEYVKELIKESKAKNIGVIMFDSLRAIHDAEENSSKEMQAVLDLFKKMNREGITVIFTHHHKKKSFGSKGDDAEMSRGSTVINASVSGHLSIEERKSDGNPILVIRHLKSKAGTKHQPLEIEVLSDKDGVTFNYRGDYTPNASSLAEVKKKFIEVLEKYKVGMARKDLTHLKVSGDTSIKNAGKELVIDGLVQQTTRGKAQAVGIECFSSEGKNNEIIYFIKEEVGDDTF